MSLRLRLVLLIVALVTAVILVLSGLYLNSLMDSLSTAALERSEVASQQVNAFILDRINKGVREYPAAVDFEQTKIVFRQIVARDAEITATLERTMALSPALVEINIAGEDGDVVASSNPGRVGSAMETHPKFSDWRKFSFYRHLVELIPTQSKAAASDYQVTVPLGIAGQSAPIFTVQVVSSSVLLRSAVLPQMQNLALVSAAALLASWFITTLATTRALRPIQRIEQTIDRISQGSFRKEDSTRRSRDEPRELAAVESKLNLLGQQYSGVRQDATNLKISLDEMVERMASQLDVATRFAAISRISGGVAHEIKNPLNAIVLRLDLLRARAEANADELIPEIDVLSKEVRRLDRVVKTFLDFSRPVDVHLTEVDLAALASEVTALMTPQAKLAKVELIFGNATTVGAENAITVGASTGNATENVTTGVSNPQVATAVHSQTESPLRGPSERPKKLIWPTANVTAGGIQPGSIAAIPTATAIPILSMPDLVPDVQFPAVIPPAYIRGDADMLKQAVLNLMTNALEVLKDGGQIKVSVFREAESVVLEVADNGPGIPPELRDKVFQLYFTTKEKGSGIGLAMVYRAVQLHNGTINFASETGRGTQFRLRFPERKRHA
jgi:signal transduction histidine kinase